MSVNGFPILILHYSELVYGAVSKYKPRGRSSKQVVKDNVYVLPLPTTLHELKTRIREACANTDQEILHVWQEVEYRFDFARSTRGTRNVLY
jgi:hypothetical protein